METRQGEGEHTEGATLVKLYAEAAAAAAGPGVTSPSHCPSHGRLFSSFHGELPVVVSCRATVSAVSGSTLFSSGHVSWSG